MNKNSKNMPLFSMIIPCYNSEEYLKRNLDCMLRQTYKNIEVILIDDGSTDNTKDIMKDFEKKALEKGIKVIIKSQKNKGLGGAINTGLKLVTGDFFGWINSDDLIVNEYIEDYVKLFVNDEGCNVIQRNGYLVPESEVSLVEKKEFNLINDWNTNPFDEHLFMNMLLEVNYNFTYAAVRTSAFDTVVKNREIYESRAGQNYQLLLPMFYNFKAKYINKPGCFFVERSTSLLRNYKNEKVGKLYEIYDEHKKIILKTLKTMNIENYDYYKKLIDQKYIVKKLEYAKSINVKNDVDYYEKLYAKDVMYDNIYESEIRKIKSKLPLVSIIIPVYNGSNYMKEAIDSAINQDYQNIEILVINDGSTDGGKTEAIAKSYGDKIRYFKKKNGGVSTALNYGINKMRGQFFSWLSHDDRYYRNKISTQMNYLINNNLLNKKVITYTNYDVINEKSQVISETHFEVYRPNKKPELAMLRGLISGTALLIPKDAFKEHGVFDTKYRCIQDYLLFFNFMKTYRFIHIPKITNSTRVHSGQVTNVNPKVIEENNYLWIKMQEETPDEAKIRLTHSLYDFYVRMERYLKRNLVFTNNDYVEARKYSLNMAKECLNEGQEKLSKVIIGYDSDVIYKTISDIYKDCNKFPTIKDRVYTDGIKSNKKLKDIFLKAVNIMGLYNTINYLYKNVSDKNNRYFYYRMLSNLNRIYPYYPKAKLRFIQHLLYTYKDNGFKAGIRLTETWFLSKLRANKYLRTVARIVKIILKILLFIPKKIIQFILYF